MRERFWFWRVRSILLENYNWTWEQLKLVTQAEVSYLLDMGPKAAARLINRDFL